MSMTFKGNTVSKFGTYLPAPYINRVELLDDRVTTYISLFFVSSGDDTVDADIISHLNSKVNVYCMHAWSTGVSYSTFGYSESDWQSVVNGEVNVFKALYEARTSYLIDSLNAVQQTSISTNMNQTSSNWTKSEDTYSEEGQRIIRFQTSVDYFFDDSAADFGSMSNPFDLAESAGLTAPEFWYTFAYTSTYEYNSTTIEDELENIKLLASKTSDISYEKVYSDGKIRRLYTQYFDAEDVIYDDIPLESLGGFYYTTSGIAQDQIKTYFEDLVTEFRSRAETMEDSDELSDLENMLDNISSVLSGYGDTATLLVQLNYLRDLFTSKSNGDIVGKLYLRFRKRIYSTNEAIESSTLLQNRITRNPKIVDSKSPEAIEGYATASYDENWPANHPNYLYDNAYYSLNTYLDDADANVYYNKGYFFFDYEKAWRQTSELSQLINVNKLYQLWGIGPVYSKFRVNHAKLTRTVTTNSAYYTTLSTTLHTNTKYAKSQYYSWTWADTESKPLKVGIAENSYVALRNFLPVEELPWAFGSDEIDNYHLMCFEFKDEFGSITPDSYDEYEIQVAIEDNSVEVLDELAAQYSEIITELEGYVNSSKEDCAYDHETGDFKPFFIDAMDNLYGANLETSPWYRAAVMYNLHRDLLLNTFDGDMEVLLENVEEIVDTIGPYTGNRFVLETFQINFETLYDSLYVNSIPGYEGPSSSDYGDSGGASSDDDDGDDGVLAGTWDADTDSDDDDGLPVVVATPGAWDADTDSDDDDGVLPPSDFIDSDDDDGVLPPSDFIDSDDDDGSFGIWDFTGSDAESEMLIFTNNYTIEDTANAASAPPPGDLAYEMSYRADWTTGSGFTTVTWGQWVDQVEEFQNTITDNRGSADIQTLFYLYMVSLMQDAIDDGSWAGIMTNFDAVFSGETDEGGSAAWLTVLGSLAAGFMLAGLVGVTVATVALVVTLTDSDDESLTFTLTNEDTGEETVISLPTGVWEQASDHDTALGGALRGWLRYMWGAIHNDGVLEPNDVSSGYST